MTTTADLWPGDTRPIDPVLGVPVNPDGSRDLSRGMPNDHTVSEVQAKIRDAINASDLELARAHTKAEIETALKIFSAAFPLAVSLFPAFVPIAPIAAAVLEGIAKGIEAA